jgi:hypothetical protein
LSPPTPLKATVAGVPMDVELTVSAPERLPDCAGLKTTPAVQLEPPASVVPHLFCVRLNGPVVVRASPAAAAWPLLVRVTVCAALVWPTAVATKLSSEGAALSPASDCPLPLSGTVTDFTCEVDEVTLSIAFTVPFADGVNVTWRVQLLPLASVAPQVVVPVAKVDADAPEIWKPTSLMGAPPVLVIVRVSALVTFTA